MPKFSKISLFSLLCTSLIISASLGNLTTPVKAAISACTANVSPTAVRTNNSSTLTFSVTNNDSSSAIAWVQISSPSSRFQITSGSSGGWSTSNDSSQITYTGSNISAGSSQNFSVDIQTSAFPTGALSWTVGVSDDSGGANSVNCGGSTAVTNSNDSTPPAISSVTVTNNSATSVTVTWTTDEASTSQVDYGLTSSYGSNQSSGNLVTSHSINLNSLTSNTTYHYRVDSSDAVGNSSSSSDDTFSSSGGGSTPTPTPTASPTPNPSASASPTPSSSSSSSSSSSTNTTQTTTTTIIQTITSIASSDTTVPTVKLTSDLSKPFKTPPILSGQASDDTSVSKVEFSIDGKNWFPTNLNLKSGSKNVTFNFTPPNLDDGNYLLLLRAIDSSNNTGYSQKYEFVIDVLPPIMGMSVLSLGAQVLQPDNTGQFTIVRGVDCNLTLSAIGGPIKITVSTPNQEFNLKQVPGSNLWTGTINLTDIGEQKIKANAIDGTGKTSEKDLGSLSVLENGVVNGPAGPVKNTQITTFIFSNELQKFVPWDGVSYGQTNPQKTLNDGHYGFVLPSGTYYMEIKSPGLKTLTTSIFTLNKESAITQSFNLQKFSGITLGSIQLGMPWFDKSIAISPKAKNDTSNNVASNLIGKQLPPLENLAGINLISNVDLRGKPTLITLLTSWLPQSDEQLNSISILNKKGTYNTMVVLPLESSASAINLSKTHEINFPILGDPQANFSNKLNQFSLPTHIFLNNKGEINSLKSGVLTTDELEQNLVH